MYGVEKECVEKCRLVSSRGDILFSIGTDIPYKTHKFGRLSLDLVKKRILFHPNRKGMNDRVVMFYLNGDDYVPKADSELIQLYKRVQEVLRKPRWVITQQGMFDFSYTPGKCNKRH